MRTTIRAASLLGLAALALVLASCASTSNDGSPPDVQLQANSTGTAAVVSVGSPVTPFPQNKQNEPAVAIDPANPDIVAAGSNDEIDLAACDGNSCPFTYGVGVSGIYLSDDGGGTWTQPSYTGLSAASAPAATGTIGTLPNYAAAGLVSDGDPTLAFGPAPDTDGDFAWDNGSRLYYGNLTSNNPYSSPAFKGFEAIAVSYTDDVTAAAAGSNGAWSDPVLVSKQNSVLFSDKVGLWADNAASSPYFGHVYVCNVAFRGAVSSSRFAAPEPVIFAMSTDGGDTWNTKQISSAANTWLGQGRQGCAIRTDSQGTIYVFFESATSKKSTPPIFDAAILMMRSTDGGHTFQRPITVQTITDCGQYDPVFGDVFFDGVAGARTDSFPSVDIANGAPTGASATNTIVATWCDASDGLNNEKALVARSTDGGFTWSTGVDATESGDRPDFPSIAISPNGDDLYLTYMGFTTDYQYDTDDPRTMQGVVRKSDDGGITWSTLHRGLPGDARASSSNNLGVEFLGDYTYVAATNDGAVAVWTDVSNAADCPAIDAFRQSILDGAPILPPAPGAVCPPTFGNTDIVGYTYVK